MTVATRNQPDVTSDTPSEYTANIDASLQVDSEVAGQFAPHEAATPNMTVAVDAGRILLGGALVAQTAQTSATITAPTTNPRIDRVVIDQISAAISVVTGAEAASPVAPDIPEGKLSCCQIALATTTTTITNSLVTDERTLINGRQFRGALVYHSADQTITTATYTHLSFDSEDHDTDSIHDTVTNNKRLTVPSGVRKIKLHAQVNFQSNGTGGRMAAVSKNDETTVPTIPVGVPRATVGNAGASLGTFINISSPTIDVSAGDYFTLCVYQNSGGNLDVLDFTTGYTYFAMEIVD